MAELYYPEGFFVTTLSQPLTAGTTTVNLTAVPSTVSKGYMIIDPNSATVREVIHFTSVGVDSVTSADDPTDASDATGRGCKGSIAVGASTPHDQGATVIIAASEKYWKRFYDSLVLIFDQSTGAIKSTLDFSGVTITGGRYTPRIVSEASSATPTPNADTTDEYILTALAAAAEFAAPTGTPTQGQKLILRIKDNGTARALTYNAIYRAIGITLPTTTVLSKTTYIGLIYNSTDTKWDAVATVTEA